jgi:soluble lytic murein transglycosylase-like protein
MEQNFDRRSPSGARPKQSFVRSAAQALAAVAAIAVAFTWASQRPLAVGRPGDRIELPAAFISPSGVELSYLATALGEDEARRLEPVRFRVASVLKRYAKDDAVADRAAAAVVAEGEKHNLDPSLLVGLMIIENSRIDPWAKSNVGATGLMQIMPFHSGQWGCDSPNLVNIEANICHGVNILAQYVRTSPNLDRALLRYNGCVRGRNTPNCHTYPKKVRGYAQHAASMMTAMEEGKDIRTIALIPKLNLGSKKVKARKAPVRRTAKASTARKRSSARRTSRS